MDSQDHTQDSEHDNQGGVPTPPGGQSRRRFTRSAAVGGAVLLTLGNRAAWGGAGKPGGGGGDNNKLCISQHVWDSYTVGGLGSMAPNSQYQEEAREFEYYASKSGKAPKLRQREDGASEYCVNTKPDKDNKDKDDWHDSDHYSHNDGPRKDFLDWGFGGGKKDKNKGSDRGKGRGDSGWSW